jgi:hypothetical protein
MTSFVTKVRKLKHIPEYVLCHSKYINLVDVILCSRQLSVLVYSVSREKIVGNRLRDAASR